MPATAWMCGGGRFCCGGAMALKRRRHCAAMAQPCRPLRCCTAAGVPQQCSLSFARLKGVTTVTFPFKKSTPSMRNASYCSSDALPELLVSNRTLACEQARDNQSLRAVEKERHRSWNSAFAPAPRQTREPAKGAVWPRRWPPASRGDTSPIRIAPPIPPGTHSTRGGQRARGAAWGGCLSGYS